jgi:hypothetical protein
MGLDWSKQRRRELAGRAAAEAVADADRLARVERGEPAEPSKAELRAEAAAAVATYRGPIKRLPTIHDLRCICGHRAKVSVQPGPRPRFRCSRCGSRL